MGNRISLAFKNKDEEQESVVLFSHWQGMGLVEKAKKYLTELKKELGTANGELGTPLTRLEPSLLIVDFIRWLTKDAGRLNGDLYLEKDKNCGDNSDNGHFDIDVNEK